MVTPVRYVCFFLLEQQLRPLYEYLHNLMKRLINGLMITAGLTKLITSRIAEGWQQICNKPKDDDFYCISQSVLGVVGSKQVLFGRLKYSVFVAESVS